MCATDTLCYGGTECSIVQGRAQLPNAGLSTAQAVPENHAYVVSSRKVLLLVEEKRG